MEISYNVFNSQIGREYLFFQIIVLNLVETISIVFSVFMNWGTLIELIVFFVRCFFLVVFSRSYKSMNQKFNRIALEQLNPWLFSQKQIIINNAFIFNNFLMVSETLNFLLLLLLLKQDNSLFIAWVFYIVFIFYFCFILLGSVNRCTILSFYFTTWRRVFMPVYILKI